MHLDLLGRFINQHPVLLHEVRIVFPQFVILQVVRFPFLLLMLVVAVDVLFQQGNGDLFPASNSFKTAELHFHRGNVKSIPLGIAEQLHDALTRQIQVVPRPFVLEVLQLEINGVNVHEGEMLIAEHADLHHGRIGRWADPLALLGLNLRIPVERDRMLEQKGIRFIQSRLLLALPLEFRPLLQTNAGELLAVQVLHNRQNEFNPILIRRQALVLEVFLELLHVLRTDPEDVQRFK